MSVRHLTAAAGFCVLAATGALAQSAAPGSVAVGAGKPAAAAAAPAKGWPVLPPGSAPAPSPEAWSAQDIQLAQARCTAILKGLTYVAVPETPLREGAGCGTPAPMKLISIGAATFAPGPIVTCDMIAALAKWLQQDLQPLARKHLGGAITRIDSLSSYSCRNAYGRANGRLSEHGRANALDIGSFVTARGPAAIVVADWGPTAREVAEQAAANKGAADRVEAAPVPEPPRDKRIIDVAGAAKQRAAAQSQHLGVAIPTLPGITVHIPGLSTGGADLSLVQPNRLGGPKPQPEVAPATAIQGKTDFLRAAHRSACRIFGTVLGPEANLAHRNHFHVDLAERVQNTKICE